MQFSYTTSDELVIGSDRSFCRLQAASSCDVLKGKENRGAKKSKNVNHTLQEPTGIAILVFGRTYTATFALSLGFKASARE